MLDVRTKHIIKTVRKNERDIKRERVRDRSRWTDRERERKKQKLVEARNIDCLG